MRTGPHRGSGEICPCSRRFSHPSTEDATALSGGRVEVLYHGAVTGVVLFRGGGNRGHASHSGRGLCGSNGGDTCRGPLGIMAIGLSSPDPTESRIRQSVGDHLGGALALERRPQEKDGLAHHAEAQRAYDNLVLQLSGKGGSATTGSAAALKPEKAQEGRESLPSWVTPAAAGSFRAPPGNNWPSVCRPA